MKCYKLFSVQAIITGLLLSTPSFAGVTDDAIVSALGVAEACLEGGDSEVVLDILFSLAHHKRRNIPLSFDNGDFARSTAPGFQNGSGFLGCRNSLVFGNGICGNSTLYSQRPALGIQ